MRNIAPEIYRQRLVVEGKYSAVITPDLLSDFLKELSIKLGMTIVFGPSVHNLAERLNPVHEGYEAVLIWAESGVQLYTWKKFDFFTLDVYTCLAFKTEVVVDLAKQWFKTLDLEYKEV